MMQAGFDPYCLCLSKVPVKERKYVFHTAKHTRIPKATNPIATTFITISSVGMDKYIWLKRE
jgi:hypothetical protein